MIRHVTAKCPNPSCGLAFPQPAERLGKNVPCPACGQVITIRPEQQALEKSAERDRIAAKRGGRKSDSPSLSLPLIAVLDGIRSLWNVGSIFRTADAVGIRRLVLCGITGTPPRKEITKTALGAEQAVPWTYQPDAAEAIRALRAEFPGLHVMALEMTESAVPLRAFVSDAALQSPIALVVGNEVAGISGEALAAADTCACLPMRGVKASLNVAVAFGVAAYALAEKLEVGRTTTNAT